MNKIKTRKAAKKRFIITKSGKVIRKHANTTHNSRKDASNAKNRKKKQVEVLGKFAKKIKRLIS